MSTSLAPQRIRSQPVWAMPLDAAGEPHEVGGKASGLVRLRRHGLRVPDGFVVPAQAFEAFLEQSRLQQAIDTLVIGLDAADPARIAAVSRTVRERVLGARLPREAAEAIHALRERLLPGRVLIVRSSGVGEDSAGASFAGQLDSIFPVRTADELEQALLRCWASRWSERSLAYQAAGRGRLTGMGVLVQVLIEPAVAGVLFSVSPDGATGTMLAEFCAGHGEALVGGHVDPGRVRIEREGGAATLLAPAEGCGLDSGQLARLHRLGLRCEQVLGGPQDIEWALDGGGTLHVVQSRPITAQACPARPAGRPVRWSNANVNENFPGPVSPLLYSIASAGYAHYFRNLARSFGLSRRRLEALEPALGQVVGVQAGRVYYNLTALHAVIQSVPCGTWLVGAFDDFVGADPAGRREARTRPRFTARERLAIALRTTWQYLFLKRRVRRFERRVEAFCQRFPRESLGRRSGAELREVLRGCLDIRCNRWNDAALADAAAMVTYGLLGQALARAHPQRPGLLHALLRGLPDLVSGQPPLELWELSRSIRDDPELARLFERGSAEEIAAQLDDPRWSALGAGIDAYLERWGFRFSGELMLTEPALDERPDALVELLRSYARQQGESPARLLERQRRERIASTAQLRGPHLRLLLRATQASIGLRERARLQQARLYNQLRHLALAIGERLVERGQLDTRQDVFLFTWQELDELLGGRAFFAGRTRRIAADRRSWAAELAAQQPPDAFELEEGESWTGDAPAGPEAAPAVGQRLTGIAASSGQALGPAIVLRDVSEVGRLRGGEILFTRQTDPGWSPVFFLIRGLVLERGGLLSHGAIIAREYGIPCVVAAPGATTRAAQGGRVRVDGDRGHVDFLD